jgi:hypothetical protein
MQWFKQAVHTVSVPPLPHGCDRIEKLVGWTKGHEFWNDRRDANAGRCRERESPDAGKAFARDRAIGD